MRKNLRTIVSAACAALILTGCGGLPVDQFGNEGRPFGTDETAYEGAIIYLANSRTELIVYCHDNDGFISTDGLNCVFPTRALNWYAWTPPCVKAFVRGEARDEGWTNAICNEWRPAIL